MVTTANMSIILVMWMTVTWAVTYMVTSHLRQQRIDVLEHYLREADQLIDQLLYDERDEAAVYELDENNNWYRSN